MAISEQTRAAAVPSMLLQPLVENAVRHGVAHLVEGGTIAIESTHQHNRFLITIRNSGPRTGGLVQNGESFKGIGLTNTAARLKTFYGDDQRFSLCSPDAGGCEVTLELPFRTAETSVEGLVCEY
jgi:LytS/YehU family sensor histidine kinase